MALMRWAGCVSASALGVVLAGAAHAEPGAVLAAHEAPTLRVLPNGLRVVVTVDRTAPLVAIDVRYAVGDAMDPPQTPGLAQTLGRLLADGTSSHLALGEATRISRAAETYPLERDVRVTADETDITSVVGAADLELALWLEAEQMGFIAESMDPESVTRQFRSFIADPQVPLGNLQPIVERAVFGPNHPYFLETPTAVPIGMRGSFVREQLREWYSPANATVAVSGDVDPGRVSTIVEKYFGGLSGRTAPPPLANVAAAPLAGEVRVFADTEVPTLEFGWATPGYLAQDNLELDVAARLLETRLRKLIRDDGYADDVEVVQRSMRLASLFTVRLEHVDARDEDHVTQLFDTELQRLESGDFGADELDVAKRRAVLDAAVERDTLGSRTRADSDALAATGKLGYSAELFRQYGAVDAAAVTAAAARHLKRPLAVVAKVVRERRAPKSGVASEPVRRFNASPPPGSAPATVDDSRWYHAPDRTPVPDTIATRVSEASTSIGVRVLTVTRSELPLVRFRVFAPWSASLPSLETFRTLPEAVAITRVDNGTLETRLASLGIRARFAGDVTGLSISVATTPDATDRALGLVLAALRHPHVAKDLVDELRKRLARVGADRSASLANFWSTSSGGYHFRRDQRWGASHPLTTTPFTQRELERLLPSAWTKDIVVSFVGAIAPEDAARAVERADHDTPRGVARNPTASGPPAARFDLVEDDRSNDASLVFSCVLPDSVVPEPAAVALPSLLASLRIDASKGRDYAPTPIWRDASERAVRQGTGTVLYFGLSINDDGDNVRQAVRALFERASTVESNSFSISQGRASEGSAAAWLLGGYDSTEEELERLYELGPEALSFYSLLGFHVRGDDSKLAAKQCFAKESLSVVGYGRVHDAAAELESRGFGPIRLSSVKSGPGP